MSNNTITAPDPIEVPNIIPTLKSRVPDANVPQSRKERETILRIVKGFAQAHDLTPPLSQKELESYSKSIVEKHNIEDKHTQYTGVLLNNELWKDQLAKIPYERRLLLLPKCLRVEERCPAPFDEFGLLCKQCGLCSIQDLESQAENLGYAVLVAEGSAVVMKLIESGQIEAIVGVSCLSVLKKTFPYMEMAAIPGIAIPLLQGDCKETNIDVEWLWESIYLTSADKSTRFDLDGIREIVSSWFTESSLEQIMGTPQDRTEFIAREWLGKDGKRWRPFLTIAITQATNKDISEESYPLSLRKCAVAVECFHKASLIHDDIEDNDDIRYGSQTLHAEVGIDIAINIGDFLIGEGYRLIAESGLDAETIVSMTSLASHGHRRLSLGQGQELNWRKAPGFIPKQDIFKMFKLKTAPAFDVAIRMAAYYNQLDDQSLKALQKFSDYLGIAYQINDDLGDIAPDSEGSDLHSDRPSLALSLCYEKSNSEERNQLDLFWKGNIDKESIYQLLLAKDIKEDLEELKESFKQGAIDALLDINDPSLKGLLRRIVSKLFNDIVIEGWCNEFEAENASSGEQSA